MDLLPTILGVAGHSPVAGLDGVDQWEAVTRLGHSPRDWMVYNMDDTMLPNFLAGSITKQKFQVRRRTGMLSTCNVTHLDWSEELQV